MSSEIVHLPHGSDWYPSVRGNTAADEEQMMRGRAEQLVVLYIFGRRRSMDVGDGVNKTATWMSLNVENSFRFDGGSICMTEIRNFSFPSAKSTFGALSEARS